MLNHWGQALTPQGYLNLPLESCISLYIKILTWVLQVVFNVMLILYYSGGLVSGVKERDTSFKFGSDILIMAMIGI